MVMGNVRLRCVNAVRFRTSWQLQTGSLISVALVAAACQGELDQAMSEADGFAPVEAPAGTVGPAAAAGETAQGGGAAASGTAGGSDLTSPSGDTSGSADARASDGEAAPDGSSVAAEAATDTAASGDTEGVTAQLPAFEPAPGMLRRLTRTQFRNSVRDVFGAEIDIQELDGDNWVGDFAVVGAATVVTSARGVEQYEAAIEGAVDQVFEDPSKQAEFVGCTPGPTGDDACARSFIENVGRKAWRRPLETAEIDRLLALTANATSELGSAVEGLRWATVALFTSPNFLYRAELGATMADGSRRVVGYEMASRLAFLLWNSLPDDALLDDAASGALDTPDGVRAAASRLLDAPAGRAAVGAFAEEFMRLDRIASQAKDTALFPEYGPPLQAAMARDMRDVWETIALDDRASILELFSTTKVVVNSELAQLYGLDTTGLDSQTFEPRSLPADSPRVGILGKPGFLSQFANQKEGSPTLRGKFMRQSLMCTTVPPPPGDADVVLDEPPEDMPMTKRERLELHRTSPACAGCHALMDPLGLPFESFDAIGRYRTTELGLQIDPSGEFDGQVVANSRELGQTMATSTTVADCLVRKYYEYAQGFEARDVDASVIDELSTSFEATGYQLRELILEVVTHDAFSRVAPQP
jgi:hypothetical protein